MRKRTTLLLKSFFRASVSLFFIFYTLTPSVLATGDVFSTPNQSVSSTTEDTKGEITKEAVSDPESIVRGEEVSFSEEDTSSKSLPNTKDGGAYTISSTGGIWTSVTCQSSGSCATGTGTSTIRWGNASKKSGLEFTPSSSQNFDPDQKFLIGTLKHMNWPVSGNTASGAKLKITLNFTNPLLTSSPTFSYDFLINETSNTYSYYKYCPGYPSEQLSTTPCDDVITFPNAYGQEVFTIGDVKYTLKIDGFQNKYPTGNPVSKFITEENKDNVAYLVGHLSSVLIEKPEISLMKKVNGDDANNPTGPVVAVGDTVNFEYIVQNTGNVALSGINVTDDKGVSVTCPQTTLESGKSMTCTGRAVAVAGQYKNTGIVTTTSHPNVTASNVAHYYGVEKINICHATDGASHQYSKEEVNMTPNIQGHNDHDGDIIPPFSNDLVNYPGKNWNEYGKSIYKNDCKVPSGTLTVKKVVTPDSDTTSFNITGTGTTSVAGAPTFLDGNTGTISGTQSKTFTVYPGTYSVTEQLPEGWRQVSNTCTDVVIAKGESKECTITNTKEAKLTIVKIAYPGNDQEFTFNSNIPENNTFTLKDTNSSPDVNGSKTFNLIEGTYSVSEKDTDGWNKTSASCSNNDSVSAISLKPGDNVTCTFVNTKYGSISGHKWNDADGLATTADDRTAVSGWTIFIDKDSNAILDEGEISTTTGIDGKYSFINLLPGTYTISEVLTVGWIQLGNLSQRVTITAGEDKENIDFINVKRPTIQVIKNVDTNGDGTVDIGNATDWQWKIGSEIHNTGSAPIAKMPGKYIVGEIQKENYHVVSLVCKNGNDEIVNIVAERTEITLKSGDDVICTFTNARNLGKLIIEKEVVNDNGGSKKATDFSFQIGSETPISFAQNGENELLGRNEYVRYAGLSYSITEVEANQDGYTTTYENCTNIPVPHNGEVVCKIKNDDNKASLTLVKEVKNDNGGELVATDWTLTATGPTTIEGDGGVTSGNDFKAGTYTLSEVGKPTVDVSGYKAGDWSCTDGVTVNENNQITLGLGQSTTCTIVNDDIAPSLKLVKVVDNKYGGNAQATDWRLTATNGPVTLTGNGSVVSGDDFQAGTYTLSEDGVVSGYEASSWSCTNGVTVNGNNEITLGLGQSTVCTITNTEKQPTLTLVKTVSNTHGGTKEVSDFNLYIGNDKVTSGVANGVSSNVEYTVREDQLAGYTASEWGGDCSADGKITLKSGENKTCTITNSDIAPSLKLVKVVDNKYGGNAQATDWRLTATNGPVTLTGNGSVVSGDNFKAGTYTLSEVGVVSGYEASSWSCTNGVTVNGNNEITLGLGQSTVCTITNTAKPATVTVDKKLRGYDDTEIFSDQKFSINLKNDSDNLILNGEISSSKAIKFEGLDRGKYFVEEVNIPDGYIGEGCTPGKTEVDNGKELNFTCTNKILKPILDIEKTNDTLGVPRYAGNNVTYTIKVSSPDDSSEGKYILKNVLLKDIAPAGFEYQSGSWTADSSLRGNIKGVEPIYNGMDVAEWSLGDMIEGEVITLTYSVRISLTQDPGVYPDVAWAVGKSLMDGDVLTSPVGTEVEVIASNEIEEGDVLGISDTHTQGRDLPNTGASTYLTLGALLTIVFGMLFIFLKDEKKRKVALSGAFLAIATLLLPTAIFAAFPVVKIETPKSPTNSSHYNISFIAAHSDKKIKEVKCFEDGILVKSIPNVNIGNCEISGKTTGTYKYYVSAVYEDDTSVSSNEVTVQVDLGKPSAVENYSKNGNVLKFRTANDGRTVKVEIFRANKATFTANSSTFIGEMPCASNTECTYTDSTAVANQKYYYAIRAVDSFGSVSPFVSDAEEVVIPAKPGTTGTARTNTTTTVTVGNSTTTSSKESVQGVTDSKGEVKGDETSTIKEEKKDNIKSEPKQTEKNSTESKGNVFKKFWYLWLSGFVIISGGVYAYVRSGKRD